MDIEKIHDYITGSLAGQELQLFESALEEDAALRTEVQLQREMLAHLEDNDGMNAAMSVISDVHQSYKPREKVKFLNRWSLSGLAIAASLALLFIIKTNIEVETTDEIYASYFSPPPASFGTKGDGVSDVLQKAELQFNSENYKEALSLFEEYRSQSNVKIGEVSFHQALCMMALGSYDEATTQFEITKAEYPLFATDSDWFLALIYIKMGDSNKAMTILEQFSSGSYADKAKVLLRKLERLE